MIATFVHPAPDDGIAVIPILADPVDVKKGDQHQQSRPSIQPDKSG